MEPQGSDAHYREKLVTLPGLGTHYNVPAASGAADRAGLDRTRAAMRRAIGRE